MSQPSIQHVEQINDLGLGLNDDSFDDEFRLLETTLTDFKENDLKVEGDSKNGTHITNDSGIISLNSVEFTPRPIESSIVFNKDIVTCISLKPDENNLMSHEESNNEGLGLPIS